MKLIIQIPCFNEEETLPAVLCDLPRQGGFLLWLCALLGELIGINRRLLEDTQYQLRRERCARRRTADDA